MKSGLEGRNNPPPTTAPTSSTAPSLNEVRPRRPEQYDTNPALGIRLDVSMKSGLEGRNNPHWQQSTAAPPPHSLNEVRPRRPEQCCAQNSTASHPPARLNEVRPRRPEQYRYYVEQWSEAHVSMKSGLEGRNNGSHSGRVLQHLYGSQ